MGINLEVPEIPHYIYENAYQYRGATMSRHGASNCLRRAAHRFDVIFDEAFSTAISWPRLTYAGDRARHANIVSTALTRCRYNFRHAEEA